MLIHANEPWSLTGFLTVWAAVVALGIAALAYIAASNESISALQMTSIAALVVPMTVLAPYGLLRRRARARQKAIVRALPDAMDLLVTSVEAGLGVDAAFAMVTEKTEGPLSDSFSLYLRQIGLGRSRQEALAYVAERTGVPDLISLATSVSQGEELGTTLGDVLRTQSHELRLARRQRAQEAAQRAPVLMTIPLALCFLPAMGAVIVVPSVMNLFNFVGDLGGG
jgi:tight adherence protein C